MVYHFKEKKRCQKINCRIIFVTLHWNNCMNVCCTVACAQNIIRSWPFGLLQKSKPEVPPWNPWTVSSGNLSSYYVKNKELPLSRKQLIARYIQLFQQCRSFSHEYKLQSHSSRYVILLCCFEVNCSIRNFEHSTTVSPQFQFLPPHKRTV